MHKLIVLSLLCLIGCEAADPIVKKVNSPQVFEATYSAKEISQINPEKNQTIELMVEGNKFRAKYYEFAQLTEELVYDGKTLWMYFAKQGRSDSPYVIYREVSYGALDKSLYFWRMPKIRLSKSAEEELDGKTYFVYKTRDTGPSGYLDLIIYVDKEFYVIKKIISKFFLNTDTVTPFTEWNLECSQISFKDDIDDGAFKFQPPSEAVVKSFKEAANERSDVFEKVLNKELKF